MREAIKKFSKERENLIPILQEIQKVEKYLSIEAVSDVSRFLDISENEIYSVASFYTQFRFIRPGEHIIKVCLGTACHVLGGERILESAQQELGILSGQTTDDLKFSLERVACVGCCALAPVVVVDEDIHAKVIPAKVKKIISIYERGPEEENI